MDGDAFRYPLGPAYLGTGGHKEGLRRLAVARVLDWPAAHTYMAEKNKFPIWHLLISTCAEILLFLY